jgi:hypothetical protein
MEGRKERREKGKGKGGEGEVRKSRKEEGGREGRKEGHWKKFSYLNPQWKDGYLE